MRAIGGRSRWLAAAPCLAALACATPPAPPPTPPADPRASEDLAAAGRAALAAGDVDGALAAFDQFLAKDPADPLRPIELAEALLRAGVALPRARAYLAPAIEARTENPRAHLVFAEVARALGDPGAAERHARRALELRPELTAARLLLADHLEATGQLEAAAGELMLLARHDPDDARGPARAARLYERLGRFREAGAAIEALARRKGTVALLYRQAAELYERADERAKARELRGIADRLDPPPAAAPRRALPRSRIDKGR